MTRVFLAKSRPGWLFYCTKCNSCLKRRDNVVICGLKKDEMKDKCPIYLNKSERLILEVW